MMIYYDWNASPNCLKTKILLNELGIEYEQRSVDRATLQGADYRAKFPTGQSPAIEDGEVRIAESGAIALYLAMTSSPARVAVRDGGTLVVAPPPIDAEAYDPSDPWAAHIRVAELRGVTRRAAPESAFCAKSGQERMTLGN